MALVHAGSRTGQGLFMHEAVTGGANAITALTVTFIRAFRLRRVAATYSGSVTKNVTVTLDHRVAAAFDRLLNTIAIVSGTQGNYDPTTEIILLPGDALVLSAEAGGGSLTSTLLIEGEYI